MIDLSNKLVRYQFAVTGESIEDDEDVYRYALKLTKMYGRNEEQARLRQAEAFKANKDLNERIVAITQYALADAETVQVKTQETIENQEIPGVANSPPGSLEKRPVCGQPHETRQEESWQDDPAPRHTGPKPPGSGDVFDYIRHVENWKRGIFGEDEEDRDPLQDGIWTRSRR